MVKADEKATVRISMDVVDAATAEDIVAEEEDTSRESSSSSSSSWKI